MLFIQTLAKIILQHISTLFQQRIEMHNKKSSPYIPAASSPTINIRQSNLPKRLLNKLVITLPIMHWYPNDKDILFFLTGNLHMYFKWNRT